MKYAIIALLILAGCGKQAAVVDDGITTYSCERTFANNLYAKFVVTHDTVAKTKHVECVVSGEPNGLNGSGSVDYAEGDANFDSAECVFSGGGWAWTWEVWILNNLDAEYPGTGSRGTGLMPPGYSINAFLEPSHCTTY